MYKQTLGELCESLDHLQVMFFKYLTSLRLNLRDNCISKIEQLSLIVGAGVCPTSSMCDVNAVCAFANGSAFCSCKAGFSGNGFSCEGECFCYVSVV